MERWGVKTRGTCQTLHLTLTVAILILRCKLLCQKLMEKMGLLVLCVLGVSPGPYPWGGIPGLWPILGEGAQDSSIDLTLSITLTITPPVS